MIQSIYTSVSNADIVPCGKKGLHISSEPIPLLRNNYLGEYRTELEKAKVRKNLGITDEQSLLWGSIKGHIEDLRDIIDYIKTMQEYTTSLNSSVKNVKLALDYALEFITVFKGEEEAIKEIQESIKNVIAHLTVLLENTNTNSEDIRSLETSVSQINDEITQLNNTLTNLNVDENIKNWIKNNIDNNLILNEKLEVKIATTEGNALSSNDQGLFVLDLSKEVSTVTENVGKLQTEVKEIFDTYVTKELLGEDFNFIRQEEFELHTNQASENFKRINEVLNTTVKTGEDGHVDTLYVNTLSNQEENIKINKSFEVQSNIPLDIRTVVKSTEDLYKLPQNTAYAGMAVANASNGLIYVLMDPTRISEKTGWKSSYESIQIITCTQDEYNEMAANTNDNYSPIEEGLPFLYEDTYYYIYENEENSLYYVTAKQIEEWLKAKASAIDVKNLSNAFDLHINNYTSTVELLNTLEESLTSNYKTSELIAEIYATKESLQDTDSKFENYYTSEEIIKALGDYVTKESLRGGDLDGEDDFVFVTLNQYNTDKEANLEKTTTKALSILQGEIENIISVLDSDLSVNLKPVAYREEIPKILLVNTKAEFEEMDKDPDTYYYICDDETVGYLTNISAGEQFYTKVLVNSLIAKVKLDLIDNYIVPLQQELNALKSLIS